MLDSLGLSHRISAWPDTLSGGEQQRVAIARALANHPTLILADEPTAALDRDRGRSVMELLRQVAREHGAAVLVVTHDQRALDVFDYLYHMEDGQIAAQGKAVTGLKRAVLYCFSHEPPGQSKFFNFMAVVGLVTLAAMAAFFVYLQVTARRYRKDREPDAKK